MPEVGRPTRRYNATRRHAQTRERRRQVVDAARRLFAERGYAGTTMEAIADAAGVAVETVYAGFGSKRAVLAHLVDLSILGDDDPTPLLNRPAAQDLRRDGDQRRQLRLFAHDLRAIMERGGSVFVVMSSAATTEPEIAALLHELLDKRLASMMQFVEWVAQQGPLRADVSVAEAAESVWALTSAEVHHLLTVQRGWSEERYERWIGDTLIAMLLPS